MGWGRVRPGQVPILRKDKTGDELEWQGLKDEKVAGMHWGYEETNIFLGILSESWIHEKLCTCHRNRQVYRIVAARAGLPADPGAVSLPVQKPPDQLPQS